MLMGSEVGMDETIYLGQLRMWGPNYPAIVITPRSKRRQVKL